MAGAETVDHDQMAPEVAGLVHPMRAKRQWGWWVVGVLALAAVVAGGVALLPVVRTEFRQRELRRQASLLVMTAQEQLVAGQAAEAEANAREALKLVPGLVQAEQVVAGAGALKERNRQREVEAAAALAAAEKLAADDQIAAAIRGLQMIRAREPVYGEAAVTRATMRIKELRAITGTLRLPEGWPEDALIELDHKVMNPKGGTITGISLGSHRLVVSRPGYRPQPVVKLGVFGKNPVVLSGFDWRMIGGRVRIASTPPGAAVWCGGRDTGMTTPCTLEQVEVGGVDYLLKLNGHVDTPLSGEVRNLETVELSGTLPELPWLPEAGKQAGERREFNLAPDLRVAFRWCPAGTFVMGGTDYFAGRQEKPARRVELTAGYWLAETELTQAQWAAVMGHQSLLEVLLTTGGGSVKSQMDHPMRLASWDRICGNKQRSGGFLGEINGFLRTNKVAGWVADLPTEAQWEYACRAGTRSAYGVTAPSDLWHAGNSGGQLQAVGLKEPNPWGLKDMHGNIAEWCRDWFVENYDKQPNRDPAGPPSGWKKSLRGGSWLSAARQCRSSARTEAYPSTCHQAIGFRLVLRNGAPKPQTVAPSPKPPPKKPAPKKPPAKKPVPKKPAPKKPPAKKK